VAIPQRTVLAEQELGSIVQLLDVRVYVQGIDITPYIQTVSRTMSDGDIGSCSISIANANYGWVLTPDNLQGKFRNHTDPQVDESTKYRLYQYKTINNFYDPKYRTSRWSLNEWNFILHKNDTVRVFMRLPWVGDRFKSESDRVWIPFFCGYVNEVSGEISEKAEPLTLTCIDLRGILQKQRVAQNPVLTAEEVRGGSPVFAPGSAVSFQKVMDEGPAAEFLTESLFSDTRFVQEGHSFSSIVTTLTLLGVVELILLGKVTQGRKAAEETGAGEIILDGVGRIAQAYADGEKVDVFTPDLSSDWTPWYDRLLTGDQSQALTLSEVKEIGENSYYGGSWSPHGENIRPRVLYPKNSFGFRNIGDVSGVNREEVDWATRLDIIEGYIERLMYRFWISPLGDPVFEYPQWDIYPQLYAGYQDTLIIGRPDQEDAIKYTETPDNVRTSVIVTGGMLNYLTDESGQEATQFKRVIIHIPSLILRYGVNQDTYSFPYVFDCDILRRVGMLRLSESISNAFTYDVGTLPWRLFLPNKPVFLEWVNTYGIITSVEDSIDMTSGTLTSGLSISNLRTYNPREKMHTLIGMDTDGSPFGFTEIFSFKDFEIGQNTENGLCADPTPGILWSASKDLQKVGLVSPGELGAARSLNPADAVASFPGYTGGGPSSNFDTPLSSDTAKSVENAGLPQKATDPLKKVIQATSGGNPNWTALSPDSGTVGNDRMGLTAMDNQTAQSLVDAYPDSFAGSTVVGDTVDVLTGLIDEAKVAGSYTPELGVELMNQTMDRARELGDPRAMVDSAIQLATAKTTQLLEQSGIASEEIDELLYALNGYVPTESMAQIMDQYGHGPDDVTSTSVWRSRIMAAVKLLLENLSRQDKDMISAIGSRY